MAPRRKSSSRIPNPTEINLDPTDPFPTELLEYLHSLPSDDHDGEPPHKKQRLHGIGTDTTDAVCIGKGELKISRHQPSPPAGVEEEISRADIGQHLRLSTGWNSESTEEYISIRSLSDAPSGGFNVLLRLSRGSLNTKAVSILNAAGENGSKSKTDQQTGLFTVINMETKRRGQFMDIHLTLELWWTTRTLFHPNLSRPSAQILREVIKEFLPPENQALSDSDNEEWSPLDFYDAAFVPEKDDAEAESIEVPGMTTSLYPFQKRTLKWLLAREGVARSNSMDDLTNFWISDRSLSGGILAEEMGLGKTLEMIGLILLHRRSATEAKVNHQGITNTGATLIVTPESLRAQWTDEFALHAPHLRVTHYSGCKVDSHEGEIALINELASQDVVVTTYSVLSTELNYVLEPPERPRRHERRYHRTKSPLMQLNWWRVCLDEAQMIESGVSRAAEVAKVVPRVHAWGITGTPVKNAVQDLRGLLIFLRYQPYNFATHSWKDLTTTHKSVFRQLFNTLAIRHTKALVRNEINLPRQDRFVITLPFAAVEEQHYQSMFKEMVEDCGLDVQGVPTNPNWEFEANSEKLSMWLNRLRQAALHPEVAMRRLGTTTKNRPMRTVDEVLDAMIDQNERAMLTEKRAYFMAKLTRGQLLENGPRVKEALAQWEKVRDEVTPLVVECETMLEKAISEMSNGNGPIENPDNSDDETGENSSHEHQTRLADLRGRLRSALESFRKCELIRTRLQDSAASQSFVTIPELHSKSERGLESRNLLEQLEELYDMMNEQANQVDIWREEAVQILLQPLVDDEEGAEWTGEEFIDATQIQEKLMVYVLILRAAIADRERAISGQVNGLIKQEMEMATLNAEEGLSPAPRLFLGLSKVRDHLKPGPRDVSMRGIISSLRQLKHRYSKDDANERYALEGRIADLQIGAIQKQSTEQTKAASKLRLELERFTASMNARVEYYRQLQAVSDSVLPYEGLTSEESMQSMLASEEKIRQKLSAAEAKHRYLINLKETGSKSREPRICIICQSTFAAGVLTVCGHQFCHECMRLWFRAHRNCPVCKTHLTPSNLHDIVLKPQELRIHPGAANGETDAEGSHEQRRGAQPHTSIYSEFSAEKLEAIKNIELHGPSFTTKVDALVRHLLWLRESDPGSKSIIFSSFPYFLSILENAFKRYDIGYTSITRPNGIKNFKEDPSLEVFILYAKAHSSGLNLVNASHVFLCEPLLNTALELQAIARIDRIGQQQETTVWLYLVDGTVEESIYNLSATRRLEHMGQVTKGKGKGQDASAEELEAANTLELEQAQLSRMIRRDRNGGEVVDKGDVWQCLFGQSSRAPTRAVSES
ncbi:related to S.pombe rad8 protein and Rdh54p [Cephalotrichum gorgonifer]|uniref:Related to S.pombe rad8 protein and Rdh54p n=1 Tax=Cephalotrichum gorgonifer TaxID=2041049 RepID=A0AAE8STL8_9PEZI|nr:related to S.pombe rad8 protein and Rdh54p [Cephalotrichum gorgonifer]